MMERTKISPKRVFINNVDSYSSGVIAKVLSEAEGPYEVVGTTEAPEGPGEDLPGLLEQYYQLTREELFSKLMQCDVIIYNITQDALQVEEALWAVTALHEDMETFSGPKMFVLVSTVMTWALSQPVDPNEDVLIDDDFRSRRPHPNFREHKDLEKKVVRLGKKDRGVLSTYVLASGLQFGLGEQLFHYFFKRAWLGSYPHLPVFGDGTNMVPTIHILDLASVVLKVVEHKPETQYLLAVDSSNNCMEEIVMAVSIGLGTGSTKNVPVEEAFLIRDMSVMEVDSLTVDMRMEAVLLEELGVAWHCEGGLVDNMDLVMEEFIQSRGLQPVRICVLGPPAVGKSTVAKSLCEHYRVHHINVWDTIYDTISELREVIHSDPSRRTEAVDQLRSLKKSMEQNGGMVEEHLVLRLIKEKLMSKPCRNHGFVLDGFPKTFKQASLLFDCESLAAEEGPSSTKKIIPEYVLVLDAADVLLRERVLLLPQVLVEDKEYDLEHFLPRLARYRELTSQDITVTDYFREQTVPCVNMEISSSDEMQKLLQTVCDTVGPPRTYYSPHLSPEELDKWSTQRPADDTHTPAAEKKEEKQGHNLCHTAEAREEQEQLEKRSGPMRMYLMEQLMPTLSQALIQCCTVRPDDPLDFLAEYLFKNAPITY